MPQGPSSMSSSMYPAEVIPIFPTPILHAKGLLKPLLVEALLRGRAEVRKEANDRSGRLTHTAVVDPNSNVLYRKVEQRVVPKVVELGKLLFGESLNWSTKEMWLNTMEQGGRQAIHSHANCFVSGIAYLTACHRSARTVFYRGLGGRDFTFSNDHSGSRPTPFSSTKWAVPDTSPGDVILFPSYLLHEVRSNLGEQRVTLAFNAIPERLKSWTYEVHFSQPQSMSENVDAQTEPKS